MTREQWLAHHVAPRITAQQWAETLLLLLRTRNHESRDHDDDNRPDEKKAG